MRKLLAVLVVCAVAFLALGQSAQAAAKWCETDPPVLVQTPEGPLLVNLFLSVPVESRAALREVAVAGHYDAAANAVVVSAAVPGSVFRLRSEAYRLRAGFDDPTIHAAGATATHRYTLAR